MSSPRTTVYPPLRITLVSPTLYMPPKVTLRVHCLYENVLMSPMTPNLTRVSPSLPPRQSRTRQPSTPLLTTRPESAYVQWICASHDITPSPHLYTACLALLTSCVTLATLLRTPSLSSRIMSSSLRRPTCSQRIYLDTAVTPPLISLSASDSPLSRSHVLVPLTAISPMSVRYDID